MKAEVKRVWICNWSSKNKTGLNYSWTEVGLQVPLSYNYFPLKHKVLLPLKVMKGAVWRYFQSWMFFVLDCGHHCCKINNIWNQSLNGKLTDHGETIIYYSHWTCEKNFDSTRSSPTKQQKTKSKFYLLKVIAWR